MQNQLTSTTTPSPSIELKPDAFIGIDYHKRYSVYHVLDAEGKDLAKGRIEHCFPEEFAALLKRWQDNGVQKSAFNLIKAWHFLPCFGYWYERLLLCLFPSVPLSVLGG
jgi:hypothetical protein